MRLERLPSRSSLRRTFEDLLQRAVVIFALLQAITVGKPFD